MRVALLALILVAVIVILPALAARRSRVGQRLVRDHHRALDTLGHIASTSPESQPEAGRSGFTTIGPSGLPTDATGPQAHVKVVSPSTPTPLPAPRPITGGWRPTRATGAAPFRRPEPRPEPGEPGTGELIPGAVDGGGPWDRVRPISAREAEAGAQDAPPVAPLPDAYHAAAQPTETAAQEPPGSAPDAEQPAGRDEPATPAEGTPTVPPPPAAEVGIPTEASDVPTGRHPLVPNLPWLPPLPVDEEDPWRPSTGETDTDGAAFPGADPAVESWTAAAAEPSQWRSTSPLAPPSAREGLEDEDTQGPGDAGAEEEPPTAPVAAVDEAIVAAAPDRPVWRPTPPATTESGSLASRRPPVEPRRRHKKKTAPRYARSRKSHKGRHAATAVAVAIVVAGGGYIGYRELNKPATTGPQSSATTTVPTTTPTTAAPSTTPPTTTPPTVTVPYKLISSSADTAVYRVASGAHITVSAVGTCWIDIKRTNAAGVQLFEETMTAGTSHVFSGPAWVRLGDPTQVTITVNGTRIKPPATDGAPIDIQFQ